MTTGFFIRFKLIYQVDKGQAPEIWDDEVLSSVCSHAFGAWCLSNSAFVGLSNEFWFNFLEAEKSVFIVFNLSLQKSVSAYAEVR